MPGQMGDPECPECHGKGYVADDEHYRTLWGVSLVKPILAPAGSRYCRACLKTHIMNFQKLYGLRRGGDQNG